eukprot:1196370-Prorocentrum_minimum.AAC.2
MAFKEEPRSVFPCVDSFFATEHTAVDRDADAAGRATACAIAVRVERAADCIATSDSAMFN